MKTLYRFVTLSVVLALLLTAACARAPAEEEKEAKPLKIGAIFPLTGGSTHEGIDQRRGAEVAVDQINALGGIGGRPLEIIFEDSESRPDAGVDAAHKLIDVDKVPVIVGIFSSGVSLPVGAYAQEQGVVMINPASTSPKCADVGNYFFSTIGLDYLMGTEEAKMALDEGCTKAAVLVPNNPYGIGMEEWMVKTFKEAGGEVLDIVEYPLEQTDYRAELQRLFAHDPECVLYTAYGEESKILNKQAFEMGVEAKWFGGYLTMCTGTADPETVEGHLGLEPAYLSLEAGEAFRKAFKAKFGEEPAGPFSYLAYDSVWLAALAMGMVGTDAADIAKALPEISKHACGATGSLEVDANGQRAVQPYDYLIFTGGEVHLIEQ